MTETDKLAGVLRRVVRPYPYAPVLGFPYETPAAASERLAATLLADLEFQEIRLTDWLGTPDGRLIESAVLALLPPLQRGEVQLVVEAVTLAARKKRQGNETLAALLTLGAAIGLGVLVVAWVSTSPET